MGEVNPFEAPMETGSMRDDFPTGEYGGIGRAAYFGGSFLVGFIANIIQLVSVQAGSPEIGVGVALLALPVHIYIAYQRLKNLGYSGWWLLVFIVPILNLLVALRCLAAPEGYADHKTLDSTGKIIMWIFIGFIALIVAAVVVLTMSA